MKFTEALRKCSQNRCLPIIPDFKMISPSEGVLLSHRNAVDGAKIMEQMGAPAISVVTESTKFGGSTELLRQIADKISIPILRKDFIKTGEDVKQTVHMGASAILLICACMNEETLQELFYTSLELGLEPLVEVHSEAEMRFACSLGAELVGINNRDIRDFERDGGNVNTTVGLAAGKPKNSFLISESGIQNANDISIAMRSGADAVLVGTAIWKAPDPFAYYSKLLKIRV